MLTISFAFTLKKISSTGISQRTVSSFPILLQQDFKCNHNLMSGLVQLEFLPLHLSFAVPLLGSFLCSSFKWNLIHLFFPGIYFIHLFCLGICLIHFFCLGICQEFKRLCFFGRRIYCLRAICLMCSICWMRSISNCSGILCLWIAYYYWTGATIAKSIRITFKNNLTSK